MKFDEDNYPRPKEMLDQLRINDLHMMISVCASCPSQPPRNYWRS